MKKRLLAIFLAVIILSSFSTGASANQQADAIFTISGVSGERGDTVDVTVSLNSAKRINSIGLAAITYDPDSLEFKGFSDYEEIEELAVFPPSFDVENMTIIIGLRNSVAFDGDLCKMTFKIRKNAPAGSTPITATPIIKDSSEVISSSVVTGSVTVITPAGTQSTPSSPAPSAPSSPISPEPATKPQIQPEILPIAPSPSIALPFTDVRSGDWYFSAVEYAFKNKLFNGLTPTTFAPNGVITRGMLVTVLYRLDGSPEVSAKSTFSDVSKDAYYNDAVVWAKENGIVNGISEKNFAPNLNITREQIAAIMHRYAKFKGIDVSIGENTNILSYDDFESISEYAISPMQWTAGSGLLKGKTSSTLNPKDTSTRAEVATIIMRLANLV